ncbi:cytochrome C [Thiorhodococcus mannitoliphagus]|uniref:Cytochrome C n=1 Tax=Thiorhodococcus mannitoliphagus TaxID=329406 RepID=A0A6P1E4H7_9GAMM|nr:cytochrome c peroxidase [Thiorhodococcus mannitoliphagus]NEX22565.1 cytochrome C [Thiorhodococcus mannitoliphagus]
MNRITLVAGLSIPLLSLASHQAAAAEDALTALGKRLFFDTTLSEPAGQSCASCHAPAVGWSGPDSAMNASGAVHEGAVRGRFGKRRPPMAAYASFSPPLHIDPEEEHFVGGAFWDGRATGWLLGSPVAEQAQGPFLTPFEQNLPDAAEVTRRICAGRHGQSFRDYFGEGVCSDPVAGFNAAARAIEAFERSAEMNAFSSKYDHYLRDPKRFPLSEQEALGLELFVREDKGNCAACHPHTPGEHGEPPLFTDFTYDNLGVARNPANPWYGMTESNPQGAEWIDPGLGGFLETVPRFAHLAAENLGKYKVPSLRNVDLRPSDGLVKAYMHNGAQKSLEEVVHFYNTRDVKPKCETLATPEPGKNCWPAPEVVANLNTEELGDLGLTPEEEAAIVAFMRTLNDGWTPPEDG